MHINKLKNNIGEDEKYVGWFNMCSCIINKEI